MKYMAFLWLMLFFVRSLFANDFDSIISTDPEKILNNLAPTLVNSDGIPSVYEYDELDRVMCKIGHSVELVAL